MKASKRKKRKRNLSFGQRSILKTFMRYMKGRRFSKSTVMTYLFMVADFMEFMGEKSPDQYSNRDVERFNEEVILKKGHSISTQRQFISGIKLFAEFFKTTNIEGIELRRPKKKKVFRWSFHLMNLSV